MTDLLVPPDEIERLTRYKQPSKQVAELKRMGYFRARRARDGAVILERGHYDAVCSGQAQNAPSKSANLSFLRAA